MRPLLPETRVKSPPLCFVSSRASFFSSSFFSGSGAGISITDHSIVLTDSSTTGRAEGYYTGLHAHATLGFNHQNDDMTVTFRINGVPYSYNISDSKTCFG